MHGVNGAVLLNIPGRTQTVFFKTEENITLECVRGRADHSGK